jgi:hypothetical protein
MSDVFTILVCIVLLSLILAIAVKLGEQSATPSSMEGFADAVTAEQASQMNPNMPILTGTYDQTTNNQKQKDPRTSQIMERELINPQFET